jgi:hypothetical protein
MHDDAHYHATLAAFQSEQLPPPPGAHFESTGAFHCQWHDLRLDAQLRRRVQWPASCAECAGSEEPDTQLGNSLWPELQSEAEARRVEGAAFVAPGLAPYVQVACNFSRAWAMGSSVYDAF